MGVFLNRKEIRIVKELLEKEIKGTSDINKTEELYCLLQKVVDNLSYPNIIIQSSKNRNKNKVNKKYRVWYKPIGMEYKMSNWCEQVEAESGNEAKSIVENMHPECKVSKACLINKYSNK